MLEISSSNQPGLWPAAFAMPHLRGKASNRARQFASRRPADAETSHSDDELSSCIAGLEMTHRRGHVAQWIRALDRRHQLSLVEELCEGLETGIVLFVEK